MEKYLLDAKQERQSLSRAPKPSSTAGAFGSRTEQEPSRIWTGTLHLLHLCAPSGGPVNWHAKQPLVG